MYPFNEYRKSYITVCFIASVIYAFVVGVNLSAIFCLSDGLVYSLLLFLFGYTWLNIMRFAIPANYSPKYRFIFIAVLIVLTGVLLTGIESLTVYLFFPSIFGSFLITLPVRVFITLLLFILLTFLFHENKEGAQHDSEDFSSKIPMDSSINAVLDKENTLSHNINRITVRSGQKIKIIPVENILYIKADGDYISIRTAEGAWMKEQTMKEVEDQLPVNSFVRIHRSFIVNMNHISRIERYGEKQLVVLHNNEKIKISAARYQVLKQVLGI